MKTKESPLYVGVETVRDDLGISRSKAYAVIKKLNNELREVHPRAIIIAGKVNRIWYEEACLQRGVD